MTAQKPQQRKLTLKQRRFVQALPLAASQTEAALIAGYKGGTAAAATKGYQLVRNGDVAAAIAAQQQAADSAAIMSIRQRRERLSKLAIPDPEHPDPMRAIDLLNRMDNLYLDRSISLSANVDAELEGFTIEELQALLSAMRPGDEKAPSAPVANVPKALRGKRKA